MIRSARRPYFRDLKYWLSPDQYPGQFIYMKDNQIPIPADTVMVQVDFSKIDTIYNIDKSFTHFDWFGDINTSTDYRYQELTAFVRLCNKLGIEALFVVEPVNERFILNYSSSSLKDYRAVSQRIKVILKTEGATFVDAQDINKVPGAFKDHQHHSNYGAFLIYKKIKHYLNEK